MPALIVASLAGCATAGPQSDATCKGETWRETQLYLGRGIPGGGEVSDAQWRDFVESVVVPRFKDGFTVLDGTGFWLDRETATTGQERSKLVVVFHPQDAGSEAALQAIASAYLRRFRQQAVLRAERPVCVTFDAGPSAEQ